MAGSKSLAEVKFNSCRLKTPLLLVVKTVTSNILSDILFE